MRDRLLLFFVGILFFGSIDSQSQDTFGLVAPSNESREKLCEEYYKVYDRLPNGATPNVRVERGRIQIYFMGEENIDKLFPKGSDGLAIDIVEQDQFSCGNYTDEMYDGFVRGTLLKPMFRKQLIKNSTRYQGYVLIDYGPFPSDVDINRTELNTLLIQQKVVCRNVNRVNVDNTNWDILETGFYRDGVDTKNVVDSRQISKTIEFIVPFKRNIAVYDAESIKPLYDSLELTDYNIIEMDIRAYTSVEGSLARNIELQEERARGVVEALQTFQNPEINSAVSAAENWVEFLDDIQGTEFEYLERLSKQEIKAELTGQTLEDLEPILSKHRKARVLVKLQKKLSAAENDPNQLLKFYDQSISEQDINQALYLQEIAFEKVLTRAFPEDFLGKLEIPRENVFGPLLNNSAIYRNELGDEDLYETIKRFEDLESFLPDNPKVGYNLVSLKLRAWREGEVLVDNKQINQEIKKLENTSIESELVDRLWVNYYMILTAYQYQKYNMSAVKQAVKQVIYYYDDEDNNDRDIISMAKYLSNFEQYGMAIDLLEERALELSASEDLIFTFINMTIFKNAWTEMPAYRALMMNALDKNYDRFCSLFNSTNAGGVSFQILQNEFLRFTYCESCQEVSVP